MAVSAAAICNVALSRIGHKRTITSLVEGTVEANACNVHYEQTRDLVLEAFDWPFARKRATLALLAGEGNDDWDFAYQLPDDCIAPRAIWNGSRTEGDATTVFGVESNSAGTARIILADEEDAILKYTSRITVVPAYSASFVDALAWKLAAELVLSIPSKPTLYPVASKEYEKALLRAAAIHYNSQRPDAAPKSEFERVREG